MSVCHICKLLQSMTSHPALARVLQLSPMVVNQSSYAFSDIVHTFTKCCVAAVESDTTVRIIGSAALRGQLLEESSFPEGCSASGNNSAFWVISLYEVLFLWWVVIACIIT